MRGISETGAVLLLAGLMLACPVYAAEKGYWNYDDASKGLLSFEYEAELSNRSRPVLGLGCGDDGFLNVNAPNLILWTDVGGPQFNYEDLDRLALETASLRLETTLELQSNGYTGWASGRFKGGASVVAGIVYGKFLIVRATNHTPVTERTSEFYDITLIIESPDEKKAKPFLDYCATIVPPVSQF